MSSPRPQAWLLLCGIRAKRGDLLPHGLMAITAPALLDAYDTACTQMALAIACATIAIARSSGWRFRIDSAA
jgi:hypothetical protein